MAIFPVRTLTRDQVKLRWGERYTSEGLNMKFLGIPNGVYLGFVPSSVAASNILTLAIDPSFGVSSLRVKSSLGPYSVDLFLEENIEIDFTFHAVFPVYVYAKADFRVNLETSAEIRTRTTPPNGIDEVGICRIDALGAVPVIDFGQAPDRHAPIANTGIPFGFMTGGAEQDRVLANAAIADIEASKIDTIAFLHPTLAARLTADYDPARIASNQGRGIVGLRSNDRVGVVGNSINLSHSFSAISKTQQPAIDIDGGGVETREGAVSEVTASPDAATLAASDTDRNIVLIQDTASNRPYVDPSSGVPVFGRLVFNEVEDLATTLQFTNGSPIVLVTVGDPTPSVSVSDLILDPDGNYQPVHRTTVPTVAAITLTTPYLGTSGSLTVRRRRFTVNLLTRSLLGVEVAYNVVRQVTVDTGSWLPLDGDLGIAAPTLRESYATNISGSAGTSPVGGITSQAFAPTNLLLYIPDDPNVVIGPSDTITGGLSGNVVQAVAGFPTIPAPNLRFYFNTVLDISKSRSGQLLNYLQIPHLDVPRATEIIDGLTRYSADGAQNRFEGVQGNDGRLFNGINAISSMGGFEITDLGAPLAPSSAARLQDITNATFVPSYFFGVGSALVFVGGNNRVAYGVNVLQTGDISHNLATGEFTFSTSGVYLINAQHPFRNESGANGEISAQINVPSGQLKPSLAGAISASRRFGTATDREVNAQTAMAQITAGNPAQDSFDVIVLGHDGGNFIYDTGGVASPISAISIVRIA